MHNDHDYKAQRIVRGDKKASHLLFAVHLHFEMSTMHLHRVHS